MKILVPVDGSDGSFRALDTAVELANDLHADVVLCHVVSLANAALMSGGDAQLLPGCLEQVQRNGEAIVAETLRRISGRVDVSSRIAEGDPIDEIVRAAGRLRPAFIVIGSHGRTGLSRALVGSVAEGVLRRAPVPVMVVPSKHREAA